MPEDENVLDSSWGNLAGYTPEQALEFVAQYAADLEDQLADKNDSDSNPSERGGEMGSQASTPDASGDGNNEDDDPDALEKARKMNEASKQPLGAEFVGRRESARRQARQQVENLGYEWSEIADQVENVMSNVPAEQQTDVNSWVEAFVYAWGRKDVQRRAQQAQQGEQGGQATQSPPRDRQSQQGQEMTEVRSGPMTSERGKSGPVREQNPTPNIEDPVERKTKSQFEKILGKKISDEEWVRLQEGVHTQKEYDELQHELEEK